MFDGEKTIVFWAGLIISTLASLVLFSVVWGFRFYASSVNLVKVALNDLPFILGGIAFILIGLYMMKSGVRSAQHQVKL